LFGIVFALVWNRLGARPNMMPERSHGEAGALRQ
jgi:hypothetical protein